jgi:molybdopterin converting factor small subunit
VITVRYWAAARAAAGVAEEQVEASDVAGLRALLAGRHGPRLGAVLTAASLVLQDGTRLPDDAVLAADAVVEVLPPFAGG